MNLNQKAIGIYLRVSTKKQKNNTSSENQLKEIQNFIKTMGWINIPQKIYSDTYSASLTPKKSKYSISFIRNGLSSLLLDAQLGKIDRVLVYSHDRLTRNIQEAAIIKLTLQKLKIPIHYCKPGENISSEVEQFNTFFENLLNNLSALESNIISQRVRLGSEYNIKKGYWSGGKSPYGYTTTKSYQGSNKTVLSINFPEARIIKEIFKLYTSCYSVKEISEIIKTNHPLNNDRKWNISTIKDILRNESYTGTLVWNKRGGRRKANRHHSSIYIKSPINESNVIITEEIWHLKEHIKKINATPLKKLSSLFLFKGYLFCSNCNKEFDCKNHGGNNRSYYFCSTCKTSYNANKLDNLILNFILSEIHKTILDNSNLDTLYTNYLDAFDFYQGKNSEDYNQLIKYKISTELELANCNKEISSFKEKINSTSNILINSEQIQKENILLESLEQLKLLLELSIKNIDYELERIESLALSLIPKDSFLRVVELFYEKIINISKENNLLLRNRRLRLFFYDSLYKIKVNTDNTFNIIFK